MENEKVNIEIYPEMSVPVKRMPATLVIGAGEIGKSLGEVLQNVYDVFYIDKDIKKVRGDMPKQFDVINICIPYSERFIPIVVDYIKTYKPNLTIIHSTVPPGTTRMLGKNVVHSPVNGRHPNLAQSILTFVKFVGGVSGFATFKAVEYLNKANIKTHVFASPESTELAKILCTTRYGWALMEMKETARLCEEFKVPFHEVYTEWNNNYNRSYAQLGELRFFRPILHPIPGEIGGHCVIPNLNLLPGDFLTETLKGRNKSYAKISDSPTNGVGLAKEETENSSLNLLGRKKHARRKSR